ncbi:site-specific integrase [Flavobacterium sp.]|uniref:site-specific integrase n=1 Tax=Flavobacterium sp. TaxID=239 RepID=UPI0024881AC5|nr:site-specific integrase [Flavobacterium sp.]MDI1317893.1 site-specific integrase [Flavobacterium sp.]
MKMKFFLRKGSKKSTINFEFRNGTNSRFRASTNFVINSENDWDFDKQKMKLFSSTVNAKLINIKLSEFENLVNELLYRENEKYIGDESIKSIFIKVFEVNGKSASKVINECFNVASVDGKLSEDFITYYEKEFLVFYSKNNSPYSKKILTKGTLTTLKSALNVVKNFIAYKKIKILYFNDINRKFYNEFIDYLTNEKKYTKNYIGTVIQKLKTVMGYAYDEDRHTNLEYKKNYFSKVTEVINHPYLNSEELIKIEELVLEDEYLNTARDIFLIGCNTGLRIGDLLDFIKKPKIISKDNTKLIQISQKKTSNAVVIPINSVIKRILDKRDGNLPNYLHQNIINEHIKSICKRAKIVDNYSYIRTEGGIEVEHSKPKYKFICTHTARRSFCTNAYYSGIPPHDIMAISGHKTEKIFFNYIKVEKQVNALRISKYPFLQ